MELIEEGDPSLMESGSVGSLDAAHGAKLRQGDMEEDGAMPDADTIAREYDQHGAQPEGGALPRAGVVENGAAGAPPQYPAGEVVNAKGLSGKKRNPHKPSKSKKQRVE